MQSSQGKVEKLLTEGPQAGQGDRGRSGGRGFKPMKERPRDEAQLATSKRVAFWQKIAWIAWTAFVIFSAVWYLIKYH